MNYKPNYIHWSKGDIVIHDADAKEPKMLMRVVGFTRDGLVKTQYVDRRCRRTIWKNELAPLHHPMRFDINPEWGKFRQQEIVRIQCAWKRVKNWNRKNAENIKVSMLSVEGKPIVMTKGQAYITELGDDLICVKEFGDVPLGSVILPEHLEHWDISWDGNYQTWKGKRNEL